MYAINTGNLAMLQVSDASSKWSFGIKNSISSLKPERKTAYSNAVCVYIMRIYVYIHIIGII